MVPWCTPAVFGDYIDIYDISRAVEDHAEYCGRIEALEDPESQLSEPIANIAQNISESTNFWDAVEPVELGYRANAKVQYRFIGALPHELYAEQRREAVRRFCEQAFGRYGLAYTAFVHEPDADGDSRNFHFHALVSQRQPFDFCPR